MTFSIDTIIENIIREELHLGKPIHRSKKLKFPCSICNKSVMKNQKAVKCDTCKKWAHIKCDGTTNTECEKLMISDENSPWNCLVCKIKETSRIFPFTLISNLLDLEYVLTTNSMKMLEMLPKFEILSKVSKFSSLDSNDIDANITNNVDCKYYPVDSFHKLQAKNVKNFNIFHSNVNGLESHFENFQQFLSSVPDDFDVINLTETSGKENKNFKCNITIEGYKSFFAPSKSNKGGTGIYFKNTSNAIERSNGATHAW